MHFTGTKSSFDFVIRDVLWFKLVESWIRGKILNVIQSMYKSIKSRVKLNNNLSCEFVSHVGVRQGECLYPFI